MIVNNQTEPAGLLSEVLKAHGGLENWSRIKSIQVTMSLGGPFWAARGWPGIFEQTEVTINPHREHISFTLAGYVSEFQVNPERITIKTAEGLVLEECVDPGKFFPASFDPFTTQWSLIQIAYFTSAAVWNYFTAPFVFTQPGFAVRELAPWREQNETWHRLAVTFPASNANHNAEQVFYYDEGFLLRRMDYSPHVTGNPPVAHYTYNHACFDRFVFPTKRRVTLHDSGGFADHSFIPITIDVAQVSLEHN